MLRWYKLIIGDNELVLEQNEKQGLAIEFSIQHYNAGEAVNSQVTIKNIPVYCLNQFADFYDKKLVLQAGINKSPIFSKNKISYSKSNVLLQGYIASVIGEPNGMERQITFIVQKSPNEKRGVEIVSKSYALNIRKGYSIKKEISLAFKSVTGGKCILVWKTEMLAPRNIVDKVENVKELNAVLESIGLKIVEKEIAFEVVKINAPVNGQFITLVASDFILQPSVLGINQLALAINLRADIGIGDTVIMPNEYFVGIQPLEIIRDTRGMFKNKNVYTFYGGSWKVVKVWHNGQSMGNEWTTHLEMVRG